MADVVGGRHFVAIATSTYDDPVWPPLSGVVEEVTALREWLCADQLDDRRFSPVYSELADNPTKAQLRAALEDPSPERAWTRADAAVVFVTGHGQIAHDTHYVILKKSDSARLRSTAIRSSDLIGWLAETGIERLVLIIDTCYAGKVVGDTVRFDSDLPGSWVVIPSATRNQQAMLGALTGAITQFLNELASPVGRQYGQGRYLRVEDFLDGIRSKLRPGQSLLPLYGSQTSGWHDCLPNPHYRADEAVDATAALRDLALPRRDIETHWDPRSRGVLGRGQAGWLFTGRADLMRMLVTTATGMPGTTLITGRAGCGKSAVLARLVTLSDQRFITQYAEEVAKVPEDLRPPPGGVDVAVLATGKLAIQVLVQICRALGVVVHKSKRPEPTAEELLASWHTWLAMHERPITIVIDALDEAADPHTLVTEVLAKLNPAPDTLRVRLLVGVRSIGGTGTTGTVPNSIAKFPLADVTEQALRAKRVRVDESPWWNQEDVTAYIGNILLHTPRSPYPAADRQLTHTISATLSRLSARSFLIARIAAMSLTGRPSAVAPDDPQWLSALNEGVVGVFRDDLHDSIPMSSDRRRAVTLMRAVAFSYGAGLPWRRIWPRVASAVDEEGHDYGDTDIAWLLDSRLGAYLVADWEDNVTVYRLSHDLIRSTLREQWRKLLR